MTQKPNTTTNQFTILIADRNPHVRKFLSRELAAEGYRVLTAKDGREVLRILDAGEPLDLFVLDLEIPDVSGLQILKKLQDRDPALPVVVHTFLNEYANHPAVMKSAAFVEKTGENIDSFKAVIGGVLHKYYQERKWQDKISEADSPEVDSKNGYPLSS
jgi:DNA-binding NtrC family response regulator